MSLVDITGHLSKAEAFFELASLTHCVWVQLSLQLWWYPHCQVSLQLCCVKLGQLPVQNAQPSTSAIGFQEILAPRLQDAGILTCYCISLHCPLGHLSSCVHTHTHSLRLSRLPRNTLAPVSATHTYPPLENLSPKACQLKGK